MSEPGFIVQLAEFYRTARHLWGRCPKCDHLFRLSDAAISHGSEPPNDWLRKLQRREDEHASKTADLEQWQGEVDVREHELNIRERDLRRRERDLAATAKSMARELLKDTKAIRTLLTEERRKAITRSRSTLLGNLFERLGPFLRRFNHDPRDLRPLFNPIDYVCFDGLTATGRVESVTFVEIKSGGGRQTQGQRAVAQAIVEGRVRSELWQIGDRGVPLEIQLLGTPSERKALPPADS